MGSYIVLQLLWLSWIFNPSVIWKRRYIIAPLRLEREINDFGIVETRQPVAIFKMLKEVLTFCLKNRHTLETTAKIL